MVAGYPGMAGASGGGDLGSASGSIELSADGAIKALESVGAGLRSLDKQAASFGTGWAQAVKDHEQQITAWGKGLIGIGGIILGAIAAPMLAGSRAAWTQVDSVEQATVALRAYEKDADKVNAVLQDLIAYAQSDMGVLFQRTDLFAAAQGLKLYGAETENLAGYVEVMSRSVGLGLSNWDDLGRIIGRVGSTGRLTGNDFDYLKAAGFQLDDSLRNTNITWDQLFAALDKGMPADAMAGQADTIRGKSIRLQSALRNLGLEFLGVDKATSKFIEGGLGDTLVKGLGQARLALLAMAPAAKTFGNAIATVARHVSAGIDALLKLPQPLITAATVIAGFSGAAMVAAGTFLLFLPRIANTYLALQRLGGLTGIISKLGAALRALTLTNPLFWVLTAAIGAVVAYRKNFLGFSDAVDKAFAKIRRAATNLTRPFRDLRYNFGQFRRAGVGPVTSALYSLGVVFPSLRRYIEPVTTAIGSLTFNFRQFRNVGVDPVLSALGALRATFPGIATVIDPVIRGVNDLKSAFQALRDGDYHEAWDKAKDAASELGEVFKNLSVSLKDWVLDVAAPRVTGWIIGAAKNVWGALSTAAGWAWSGLVALGAWTLTTATPAIAGWVADHAGDVWAGIKSAAGWSWDKIGDLGNWTLNVAVPAIVETGTSLIETFGTWIATQIEGVNWLAVASTISDKLRGAFRDGVQFMADITSIILNWITKQIEGVDWNSVGSKFAELLVAGIKGIGALVGLSGLLFLRIIQALGDVSWSGVGTAFKNFMITALSAIWDFFTGFAGTIKDELVAMFNAVDWGAVGTTLKDGFVDAVAGVGTAIGNAIWNELPDWLRSLISGTADFLGGGSGPKRSGEPSGSLGSTAYRQDHPGVRTEYSDPYRPNEGGKSIAALQHESREAGNLTSVLQSLGAQYRTNAGQTAAYAYVLAMLSAEQKETYERARNNQQVLPGVTSAWSGFGGVLPSVSQNLTGLGGSFGELNTTATTQSGQMQSGVLGSVGSMASGVLGSVTGMAGSAIGSFLGLNTSASGQTKGMQGSVTGSAASMAGGLLGSVLGMQTGAISSFGSMNTGASGQAKGMQGSVTGSAKNMQGGVLGAVSGMSIGMIAAFVRTTAQVIAQAAAWIGAINAAAGAMASAGYNAGAAAGYAVANGLAAARGAVASEAAAIADIVARTMALRLQIHSPSRVIRRLIESGVGPAVVGGIRAGVPQVIRAARDMADALLPRVDRVSTFAPYGASVPTYAYASRASAPVVTNYHHVEYIALSSSDLQRLTEQAGRGAAFADARSRPDAMSRYTRGMRR